MSAPHANLPRLDPEKERIVAACDQAAEERRGHQRDLAAWKRSVDVRRFMTSRFVRRGASYGEALRAAHTLFPLPPMPKLPGPFPFRDGFIFTTRRTGDAR